MNELLRAIPKVTELYDLPEVSDLREHYASSSVTEWIRTVLEQLRSAILSGEVTTLPTLEELGDRICRVAARESLPSLRPVINATGVILHTNLGRGCLSDRAADAVYDIARGYSTLEYNVEAGIGEAATTMWKSCCAVSLVPRVPWWSTITPPPSC